MINALNLLVGIVFVSILGFAVHSQAAESFGEMNIGAQAATALFVGMSAVVAGWFAFEPKRTM